MPKPVNDVGTLSARAGIAGLRRAATFAAVGLLLVGCGGTTKTVTKKQASTPTSTRATQTDPTRHCGPTSKEDIIDNVVVQRGIGNAELGMSQAQVRSNLGPAFCSVETRNRIGPYTEFNYYDGFTVAFQRGTAYSGRASSFVVDGTRVRTPEGVGVDSTEADVRAHVRGAICEIVAGYRSCHLGKYQSGRTITEFRIVHGRVTHVRVARVGE
jgi:hypothetical protein